MRGVCIARGIGYILTPPIRLMRKGYGLLKPANAHECLGVKSGILEKLPCKLPLRKIIARGQIMNLQRFLGSEKSANGLHNRERWNGLPPQLGVEERFNDVYSCFRGAGQHHLLFQDLSS